MSLMLRQACQEILDNSGLQNYHVRISDSNKSLVISGECGKPLVSIQGIRFTRLQPTKAEIVYAIELLEAFLVKHNSKITKLVQLMSTRPKFNWDGYPEYYINRIGWSSHLKVSYRDEFLDIDVSVNIVTGKITYEYGICRKTPELTPTDFNKFKTSKTKEKQALKILNLALESAKHDNEIDDLKTELNICDI